MQPSEPVVVCPSAAQRRWLFHLSHTMPPHAHRSTPTTIASQKPSLLPASSSRSSISCNNYHGSQERRPLERPRISPRPRGSFLRGHDGRKHPEPRDAQCHCCSYEGQESRNHLGWYPVSSLMYLFFLSQAPHHPLLCSNPPSSMPPTPITPLTHTLLTSHLSPPAQHCALNTPFP